MTILKGGEPGLLRFFDRAARSADQAEPPTAGAQATGASPLTAPEYPPSRRQACRQRRRDRAAQRRSKTPAAV